MTRQRTRSTERAEAERRRRERNEQSSAFLNSPVVYDYGTTIDTSPSPTDAGGSDCSGGGGE